MENQDQDKLLRLYTRLNALKINLSPKGTIQDNFVGDYHLIVSEMESLTGSNLVEFKIPMSEVKPLPTGGTTNQMFYTSRSYCSSSLFFSKLDALMTYFQLKYLSNEKPQIGFVYKEE